MSAATVEVLNRCMTQNTWRRARGSSRHCCNHWQKRVSCVISPCRIPVFHSIVHPGRTLLRPPDRPGPNTLLA